MFTTNNFKALNLIINFLIMIMISNQSNDVNYVSLFERHLIMSFVNNADKNTDQKTKLMLMVDNVSIKRKQQKSTSVAISLRLWTILNISLSGDMEGFYQVKNIDPILDHVIIYSLLNYKCKQVLQTTIHFFLSPLKILISCIKNLIRNIHINSLKIKKIVINFSTMQNALGKNGNELLSLCQQNSTRGEHSPYNLHLSQSYCYNAH